MLVAKKFCIYTPSFNYGLFFRFRAIAWNSVISQPHQHTKLAELDRRRPQPRLKEKKQRKTRGTVVKVSLSFSEYYKIIFIFIHHFW